MMRLSGRAEAHLEHGGEKQHGASTPKVHGSAVEAVHLVVDLGASPRPRSDSGLVAEIDRCARACAALVLRAGT
jgi:hypothetical protein